MNRRLYGICLLVVTLGVAGAFVVRGRAADGRTSTTRRARRSRLRRRRLLHRRQGRSRPGAVQPRVERRALAVHIGRAPRRVREGPERYAPAFGGYCAYGVSRGYAVDIDPEAFAVVDGTLYLNYSKGVQRTLERGSSGYIEKALQQWPKVLAELK